jgi:hypothetical protein
MLSIEEQKEAKKGLTNYTRKKGRKKKGKKTHRKNK